MVRTSLVSLAVLSVWILVAAVALASVNATPHLWRAEVGAIVVATTIVGAWFFTRQVLRLLGMDLPYRPE
jgi:uncharacterized membrane protein